MRLRTTTKIRNDHMIEARKKLRMSQAQLANRSFVTLETYAAFERLNYAYKKDPTGIISDAESIAMALGIPMAKVLPDGVLGFKIESNRSVVEDIDNGLFVESAYQNKPLLGPEDAASNVELRDHIKKALGALSFRERQIIEMRFGLNGEYPLTLEEVGRIFKITRERVRMVEAKALHTLQYPAFKLVGFAEYDGYDPKIYDTTENNKIKRRLELAHAG